ncbi:MAG: hypothetical protein HFE63_05165 [Clostridiales bacterium]|nr:hypothetical protein [Clostridiales bacterium]
MSVAIGLDFGDGSTKIYLNATDNSRNIALDEPSIAAVDPEGNVIAVGTESLMINGRTPGAVTVRSPIHDSIVTDFNLAAEMLDRFIERAAPHGRKRVYAAVKCGIDGESRELYRRALNDCRVSRIELIESPIAALIGSGYNDDGGALVCDIGAGSIECSYLRGGDILRTETYFGGGDEADKSIAAALRRKYGIAVDISMAREAKQGLDFTLSGTQKVEFTGIDTSTGMPKRIEITDTELLNYSAPQIKGAADSINAVLSNLPRYAGKEATVERIILVGGGALMPGLSEYIQTELGREIIVPNEPQYCVVRGLGKIISGE